MKGKKEGNKDFFGESTEHLTDKQREEVKRVLTEEQIKNIHKNLNRSFEVIKIQK